MSGRPRAFLAQSGVASVLGIGVDEFEASLYAGRSGVRTDAGPATAGIADFDPREHLGKKGLRSLDRAARLLCVALNQILSDPVPPKSDDSDGLGLVCGTMLGGLDSIVSFDWSGLSDGVKYVNPGAFPNTVINSAVGQAAIRFGLTGVNSTLSAGASSGLYAMHYAAELIRMGGARLIMAGGVDELSDAALDAYTRMGLISPRGVVSPFANDRDGTAPGEGAAVCVLLAAEDASAVDDAAPVELAGWAATHDPCEPSGYDPQARGAAEAIRRALADAGIAAEDVACVVSSASGSPTGDAMEELALAEVFGGRLGEIPICCPKAAHGEAMGASGAFAALIGALALKRQELPPTRGASSTSLCLSDQPQSFEGKHALVTALSCGGENGALIQKIWTKN